MMLPNSVLSFSMAWFSAAPAGFSNGRLKLVFAMIFVSLTGACATNSEIPVSTIYASQQCAISDSRLMVLDSPEQLYAFVESARRFQLTKSKAEIVPPAAEGRAVAVAWGNHPNGGYRLELAGDLAVINEGTLNLPVNFITPTQGQVTAQLITSPCLVISVDSREGYQRVQAGELQSATFDTVQ